MDHRGMGFLGKGLVRLFSQVIYFFPLNGEIHGRAVCVVEFPGFHDGYLSQQVMTTRNIPLRFNP